jgi:hypothetical protein
VRGGAPVPRETGPVDCVSTASSGVGLGILARKGGRGQRQINCRSELISMWNCFLIRRILVTPPWLYCSSKPCANRG